MSQSSSSRTNTSGYSAASLQNRTYGRSSSTPPTLSGRDSRHVPMSIWSSNPQFQGFNSFYSQQQPMPTFLRSFSFNDLPQVKNSGPGSWTKSRDSNLPTSLYSATYSQQQPMTKFSISNSRNDLPQGNSRTGSWLRSQYSNLANTQHFNNPSDQQQHMTLSGSNSNNIYIEQQTTISHYSKKLWEYVESNPSSSTWPNFKDMASFRRVVDDMIISTINSTLQQYPSNIYTYKEIVDSMIKSIHHSISQQYPTFEKVVDDEIESDRLREALTSAWSLLPSSNSTNPNDKQ